MTDQMLPFDTGPVAGKYGEMREDTGVQSNPVATERRRLTANALRVLALLKARGPVGATNVELSTPECGGIRAIGRCWELKQDGWKIEKQHEGGGVWRYTLTENPPRL